MTGVFAKWWHTCFYYDFYKCAILHKSIILIRVNYGNKIRHNGDCCEIVNACVKYVCCLMLDLQRKGNSLVLFTIWCDTFKAGGVCIYHWLAGTFRGYRGGCRLPWFFGWKQSWFCLCFRSFQATRTANHFLLHIFIYKLKKNINISH